jgi:hypothetical protein
MDHPANGTYRKMISHMRKGRLINSKAFCSIHLFMNNFIPVGFFGIGFIGDVCNDTCSPSLLSNQINLKRGARTTPDIRLPWLLF